MKNISFIIAAFCAILSATGCAIFLYGEYGLLSAAFDVAIFAALPVMIVAHEAGHMLFGALVKIKAVPRFTLSGSSSCKIIPRTHEWLRGRMIFTAFGGIAVNLVFVVIAAVAPFVPHCGFVTVLLPSSLYLLILNAIPAELPEGKTDGLVINNLIKNTDEAKVMLAVLSVQAQILGGKSIGEVDGRLLFDLPVIREDDPSFISLTQLRLEYYKAIGDKENEEKQEQRLKEIIQYL